MTRPAKLSILSRLMILLTMPPLVFGMAAAYAVVVSIGFVLVAVTGSRNDADEAGKLMARLFGGRS